jgi:hypothetical protein
VFTPLFALGFLPKLRIMGTTSLLTQRSGTGDLRTAGVLSAIRNPALPEMARTAVEGRRDAKLWTPQGLPDPAICRAKAAGMSDCAYCLVERPYSCQHALGFGYGFYCRHPQLDDILLRTACHVS